MHYKVGAPVRFERPEAEIFGLFGSKGPDTLISLGLTTIPRGLETFITDSFGGSMVRVSRGRDIPASGFTLHVPPAAVLAMEEGLRALVGEPMPPGVIETLRVEEGIPWHGIDVQEENLLHETSQLSVYHSSTKGCYLGQEVVARLEGRGGNVNKRLVFMKCSRAVSAGEDVTRDTRVVGRVTSAGVSPEFGPIAMGYVHRTHADAGAEVDIGGARAQIHLLPFRS
jgi:folate-binding protein YgfZ